MNVVASINLALPLLLITNIASAANVKGRPLVVIVTPRGPSDSYYGTWHNEIVAFQKSYAEKIMGKDNVIIIAPKRDGVYDKLVCEMPGYVLEGEIKDIWSRDYGASRQKDPVMFRYFPNYIEPYGFQNDIRQSFNDYLANYSIGRTEFIQSDVILDGGNFVDNGENVAVITNRVFKDNRKEGVIRGKRKIRNAIRDALGWDDVVIIKELKGDTTGHTDGMVSFLESDVLALSDLGRRLTKKYTRKLRRRLPQNIQVIPIPNKYVAEKFTGEGGIGFTSACGLHINALTTTKYIYVPTFGHDSVNQGKGYDAAYDKEVLAAIRAATSKTVVEIPVDNVVCRMGGSVRCLSWQIEGTIADKLVEAAQKLGAEAKCSK